MKNKFYLIVISMLLVSIFSGCVEDRTDEVIITTREFIKEYVPNPETIQFNNETIIQIRLNNWNVLGSGTIEYEGSRKGFSYRISVGSEDGKLKCILKELIIGEV